MIYPRAFGPAVIAIGLLVGPVVSDAAAKSLTAFVSIAPEAYLVERLGGKHVEVHVLADKGQDPHTFQATPRQMLALARADLFFKTGLPFEDRLVEKIKAGHRRLTVVDLAKTSEPRGTSAHSTQSHDHHGHDHNHGADQPDPHTWLSPPLLKLHATAIARALRNADPARAEVYQKNLDSLLDDIDARHAKNRLLLTPYRGQTVYVFHPAFGHFCSAYGLKQEAVELEGKSPTPRRLRAVIKQAKADNVRVIFVQPQFDQRHARTIALATGGRLVPIDPLAKDVLDIIEKMAAEIAAALKK